MSQKSINKSDIIEELALQYGIPRVRAEVIVNGIFSTLIDALDEGKRAEFRGFGSFAAKEYEAYIGRNPHTGEATEVPAKRRIRFKMSEVLFSQLNKDLDG